MFLHGLDGFVREVVKRELTPKEHEAHPDLDVLLAVLASDVSEDTRGAVVAHVATCLACQEKWRAVERTLTARQERLEARVGSPRLSDLVRERERTWELARTSRARRPVFRLGPVLQPVLVPALVSVAAVAITLGVGIPLARRHEMPSERLLALTREVEALRDTTHALASALVQTGVSIPANVLRPEVSLGELLVVKEQAEQIDDPWQRALYVASRLSRWGIEPSTSVNWQSLEPYTARAGDTWQTLAVRHLGDRGAWPVLWLLNSNVASLGQDIPIGSVILIPSSSK